MGLLVLYRKTIVFLSFWILVCSVFVLWNFIKLPVVHWYPDIQNVTADLPRAVTVATPTGLPLLKGNLSASKENTHPVKPSKQPSGVEIHPVKSVVSGNSTARAVNVASTNLTASAASMHKTAESRPDPSKQATSHALTKTPSPSPATGKLLCVTFTGRLGNELFEYASTLGLALTLNRTPVFQGSAVLSKVLKNFTISSSTLNSSTLQQRCKQAKRLGEESCCKYKAEMTKLDPKYDYKVGFYLQSYRYFEKHEAAIRKAVTFNDRIQTQVNTLLKELRQKYNSSVLVGVHIRRGDMALDNKQKFGYPLAGPGYINRSLAYFTQLLDHCVFVVASDSLQWCKQNFPSSYSNVHFLNQNEAAVDMLLLASMDHVITSFGSFSWWIGFLNKGKTVYMKDFIRANTELGKAFNPKGRDYIYPGWTPL